MNDGDGETAISPLKDLLKAGKISFEDYEKVMAEYKKMEEEAVNATTSSSTKGSNKETKAEQELKAWKEFNKYYSRDCK